MVDSSRKRQVNNNRTVLAVTSSSSVSRCDGISTRSVFAMTNGVTREIKLFHSTPGCWYWSLVRRFRDLSDSSMLRSRSREIFPRVRLTVLMSYLFRSIKALVERTSNRFDHTIYKCKYITRIMNC